MRQQTEATRAGYVRFARWRAWIVSGLCSLLLVAPAQGRWTPTLPNVVCPPSNLGSRRFLRLAVISPTNIWASGFGGYRGQPLVEHWDGTRWTVVPFPVGLSDLAATSTTDVWGVGYGGGSPPVPLRLGGTAIAHWDGHHWSEVPSGTDPGGYTENGTLRSVVALSSRDAWAVGTYAPGGDHYTLIEHWDGQVWRVVPGPNTNPLPHQTGADLYAVAALSSRDAWAVGTYIRGAYRRTLVEHWDGTTWRVVPSPNLPSPQPQVLTRLSARSSRDLWALGSIGDGAAPLIEHWNGTAWQIVSAPASPQHGAALTLNDILARGTQEVWVVGSTDGGTRTVAARWDGGRWQVLPSVNVQAFNSVASVAAVGAHTLWAVGYSALPAPPGQDTGTQRPLVEQWDGGRWRLGPLACA